MTWRRLVVGLMHADTYQLADDQRIPLITAAAARLKQFRDVRAVVNAPVGVWDKLDSRPSMILVAPEYMLAKHGTPPDDDRLHSLPERDLIHAAMKQLSAQYGESLVLAPGSIAYAIPRNQVPQQQIDAGLARGLALAAATKGHDVSSIRHQALDPKYTPVQKTYIQKEADRIQKLIPQQYSPAGDETPTTAQKRQMLAARDAVSNELEVQYIAKNEMVMYHKGKDVAHYSKVADFNEVSPTRMDAVFIPGATIGRTTVAGIPWGIEICFDHDRGVLDSAHSGVAPRVHLLCSAAVKLEDKHLVIDKGGYVIHACTAKAWCCVKRFKPDANEFEVLNSLGDEPLMGGQANLLMYEIELNLP